MKKKVNKRCPLQAECERKCQHEGHELDCDYYHANARDGYTIEDQEQERERRWRENEEALFGDEDDEEEADAEVDAALASNTGQLVYIPIERLHPHPSNPRKDLGDLSELADSIKAKGVLQNLTVVPMELTDPDATITLGEGHYTIIIGHRRHAGAKLAGLQELPCVIVEMDEKEQVQTMLLENMQRSDLTVYEQAQGFQMMLDMGSTVEEIAEKSGFSQTTVRRRVKLLDLDRDKFKKSEERGATLFDYMELDKIKDIQRKNEVLDHIGTENFKYKLKQAIDAEKAAEKLAQMEAIVATFATKVDTEDGYRYVNSWGTYSDVESVKAPDDADTVQYFYFITSYNAVRLMKKADEKKVEEDLAAKEREAKLEARRSGLAAATRRSYELRSAFADGVSGQTIKKHLSEIMAFWIHAEYWDNTGWIEDEDIEKALNLSDIDGECDEDEDVLTVQMVLDAIAGAPEKALWKMIWMRLDDSDNNGYWSRWRAEHEGNKSLDDLYALLVTLGYEMSDDEKALQDGSHELFRDDVPAADTVQEKDPCALCKSAHPGCDKCCNTCDTPCNAGQVCRRESEAEA